MLDGDRWRGSLPPFDVDTPWPDHVEPIASTARARFGIDITVLRVLSAEPTAAGSRCRYLVRIDGSAPADLPIRQAEGVERTEPRRSRWATAAGFDEITGWADRTLAEIGRPRTGPIRQLKTWNLSSVMRFPTTGGAVWCKSVPAFLADEGRVLKLLQDSAFPFIPAPLGHDAELRTTLLPDIPGEDQFKTTLPLRLAMVENLVTLQQHWIPRWPELPTTPVSRWRANDFIVRAAHLLHRREVRAELTADERTALDRFVGDLPAWFDRLAGCGLPDTLVRGDFTSGNWRSGPNGLFLIDWGEVGVGHPLLDLPAFFSRVPAAEHEAVERVWFAAWRRAIPGCDPARAAALIRPLGPLCGALVYRHFLDHIEPDEQHYHRGDVPACLRGVLRELGGPAGPDGPATISR